MPTSGRDNCIDDLDTFLLSLENIGQAPQGSSRSVRGPPSSQQPPHVSSSSRGFDRGWVRKNTPPSTWCLGRWPRHLNASPQQGDLRVSGPSSGHGAGVGARTCDIRVPADLQAG
ncbi:hypothetical protein PoB_001598300 [Plakobranchus ocellatus]|uniref:Uncharacterized protein n=1 Tax=Plakobranchus ocellatus TaxID=259542 RepID=A0AAV3Z408_9GAST|nr:hypothetical protein PoB_001598300 [Plakobranchus ocellatus]